MKKLAEDLKKSLVEMDPWDEHEEVMMDMVEVHKPLTKELQRMCKRGVVCDTFKMQDPYASSSSVGDFDLEFKNNGKMVVDLSVGYSTKDGWKIFVMEISNKFDMIVDLKEKQELKIKPRTSSKDVVKKIVGFLEKAGCFREDV